MATFWDALADCRQSHRCFNHEHAHELMDYRISCTNMDLGVEGVYTCSIIPADCFSLGIVAQSRVDLFYQIIKRCRDCHLRPGFAK